MVSVWKTAEYNFRKWSHNPKIWVIFILLFFLIMDRVSPYNEFAKSLGAKNTIWFLPFLGSDLQIGLYILYCFMLLFCDVPFRDRQQPYVLIRIGKTKWFLGEMLYIVQAGFLVTMFIQLCVIISILPSISLSGEWGKILYTASVANVDFQKLYIYPSYSVIDQYTPLGATIIAFVLIWMEGIIIGIGMFLFNLKFKKMVGTIVGGIYATSFFVVKTLLENMPLLWKIMPAVWMDFATASMGYVGHYPSVAYVISGFSILFVLISLMIWREIKVRQIEVL